MPVSRMMNRGLPGVALRVGDAAHQDPGRRHEEPARLEQQVQARLAHRRQHGRRVLGRAAVRVAVVADAEAAAEVEVLEPETGIPHLARQVRRAPAPRCRAARRRGSASPGARAGRPPRARAWRPGAAAAARRRSMGTPNLLKRCPVEMCACVLASMSGFTRRATRAFTPRARASASMRSASPSDSMLMAFTPRRHGAVEFVARLADAREHDLRRLEPRPQRRLDLAARVRVGAGAQFPEEAQDGQRRVRLQRVVDRVRVALERRVERRVGVADEGGAVDVDRRPGGARRSPPPGSRRMPAARRVQVNPLTIRGILSEASRV